MIVRSNFVERRRHHRFKLKNSAAVQFRKPGFFSLGRQKAVKSAQIVDISESGLSFQYTAREMLQPFFRRISISDDIDRIKIRNVPFSAVSDFSVSRISDSLFLRRCGLKFGKLSAEQKHQLHFFIHNHTINTHPVDRRAARDRRQSDFVLINGSDRREGRERRKRLIKN